MHQQIHFIKDRFHLLVGSLSIREIMNNKPLIDQIKTLSSLLLALTSQKL